eukprot:142190_1
MAQAIVSEPNKVLPDANAKVAGLIARQDEGGYKMALFVKKRKAEQYRCGMCAQVCYNAVELVCSACGDDDDNDEDAIFCEPCLKAHLNSNRFTCPLDKNHTHVWYKTCQYIRDKVNNSIMRCPTGNDADDSGDEGAHVMITKDEDVKQQEYMKSCGWKGKVNKLLNHLGNECEVYEKPLNCKYHPYGCAFSAGSKLLKQHHEESVSQHMDLLCHVINQNKEERDCLKAENEKLRSSISEIKMQLAIQQKQMSKQQTQMSDMSLIQMQLRSGLSQSAQSMGTSAPLTAEMLAGANPAEKHRLIGHQIFSKISMVQPRLAGKLTGMLLEMDNTELLRLLGDQRALMEKVNEALAVLKDYQQNKWQQNRY